MKIKKKEQVGFTLIELIMVVVILGVLSAYALPRFSDFRYEAEKATAEGGLAALKAASGIVHAQAIIEGKTKNISGEVVSLEGSDIRLKYGYSTAEDIANAAGLEGFNTKLTDNKNSVMVTTSKGRCKFSYTEPKSAMKRPTISDIECLD